MAVNKETLQLDVISNIDKVLKDLGTSVNLIKNMSKNTTDVNLKFLDIGTSLKEINTALRLIGNGKLFDQLLGAQNKLNVAQKRTVEQYKAIEAAQRYNRSTDLSKLNSEQLSYTLKGQTLKLYRAERLMIGNTAEIVKRAVETEKEKLNNLNIEIERRKALAASQRESERQAERAAKKALQDAERLGKQQEKDAKKAADLAAKSNKPFTYSSANDITRMKSKINDKEYLDTQRKLKIESVLGDGGAGLFKIQAGLLANYTLLNTFFSTLSFGKQFVMELDNSLRDLQAITATTEGNMEGLRQKIIEVSEGTKFTAVEVANAAKIMGQAGFSTQQIKDSLQGVVLLATATGSSLEEAADTATSVISVFNLRAEDMTHVSNVMTEAINKSKLSMDKLALGIQYAGNIAAESGLTFEETTAILGAMSNAGIKSGSTLGTGLRQVLIEMQNPTEKFKKNLAAVGLTMSDVDVKSKGFVGVMKTLRDAGFDTTRAFESFEVRSAAAFAAIQNNPKLISELAESFLYTNAAVEANEVQMKSLTNTVNVLKGNFGLLINDLSGPFTTVLKVLFKGLSELITILREYPAVITAIGTALISLTTAFAAGKIVLLLKNLTSGMFALKVATTAVEGVAAAGLGARLLAAFSPLGLATILLSGAAAAAVAYSDSNDKLTESMEASKARIENLNGEYEKTGSNISTLSESLDRLTNRFVELKNNPEEVRLETIKLQRQFSELGLELKNGANSSIYELIEALKDLRQELNVTATDQLKATMAENAVLFRQQAELARSKIKESNSNYNYYDAFTSGKARSFVSQDPLFNQGKSLRNETANLTSSLGSVDIYSASEQELTDIKTSLNALYVKQSKHRGALKLAINKLDLLGEKRSDEQDALLVAYTKESEAITEDMANTNSLLSTAATVAADKLQTVANEIRSSDISRAVDDRLTQFNLDIADIKNAINGESDTDKEKAVKEIQDKISELRADLTELVASSILDDVEYVQMGLIDELAIDSLVDDLYGSQIAGAQSGAKDILDKIKQELNDSANKSSDAFNTAMQMAKDGFDVIKESYDDIGRQFDARIKSYQDIIDANSNPYSGTYGQYSDAEIEAIKKKQYQQQVGATKARLDALPGLISNLDGVISKQAKGGISVDANGNSVRSSVQANKQLNDLIKQKNKLVQEQIALEAEYDAMMGRTTEAHMTFGEQLRATIQDYVRVQNAQSSWTANIRENLISTFDSAKASFSDMVYGFVTGSKTAGDSIKAFATSVLESMLKIATNKLAESIFGMVLGGIFGSSGKQIYSSPIGPTMPTTSGFLGLSAATGGFIKRMAAGGANRDSVPALLKPGEYVLRNQAVDAIGRNNLDMINAMGARTISQSGAATQSAATQSNAQNITNVWVVTPDQKPGLTKADVIVTIADDINRGGSIKKLVKTVVNGG